MPDSSESVHRFDQAYQFRNDYLALVCKAQALQPIAQAFMRNMNRVRGIGALSINLMSIAMINEAARVEAIFNKNLRPGDPRVRYGHPQFDENLFSEVEKERKQLMEKWMKSHPSREDLVILITTAATYGMNIIIDENKAEAREAVQATMAAMLIGLWTAFESLAQDTWLAAVNACPIPLAERVVEPSANLETGMQLKSISMREAVRSKFDLTNSMGDILLRQRAVDFQSLKTIRAAYKTAFAADLEPIFETHSLELFRLEAVRNLFVHKGGLIDRKFIERMGNEPNFKDKIGQSLSVHGEYVAQKANVVSTCSTQLIEAVDKWLLENPESKESED